MEDNRIARLEAKIEALETQNREQQERIQKLEEAAKINKSTTDSSDLFQRSDVDINAKFAVLRRHMEVSNEEQHLRIENLEKQVLNMSKTKSLVSIDNASTNSNATADIVATMVSILETSIDQVKSGAMTELSLLETRVFQITGHLGEGLTRVNDRVTHLGQQLEQKILDVKSTVQDYEDFAARETTSTAGKSTNSDTKVLKTLAHHIHEFNGVKSLVMNSVKCKFWTDWKNEFEYIMIFFLSPQKL